MSERLKLVSVEPREGYRIWIRYNDGVEGEIDLSRHAKHAPFEVWKDREYFESVCLDSYGDVNWPGGGLDFCTASLYLKLTGKPPDEVFSAVFRETGAYA